MKKDQNALQNRCDVCKRAVSTKTKRQRKPPGTKKCVRGDRYGPLSHASSVLPAWGSVWTPQTCEQRISCSRGRYWTPQSCQQRHKDHARPPRSTGCASTPKVGWRPSHSFSSFSHASEYWGPNLKVWWRMLVCLFLSISFFFFCLNLCVCVCFSLCLVWRCRFE